MSLTKKRRVFVEEYLQCWNSAEAARRAGYSERTARTIGSKLLTIIDIAKEIEKRISEKAMAADEVLIRLADQARSSIGDYITQTGGINIEKVISQGHLVKSYNITTTGRRIELHSSQRALELLGKRHALFIERQEISGPDGKQLVINLSWGEDADDND